MWSWPACSFGWTIEDRSIILQMRSQNNQLGFAIQLGTVLFLGTFLSVPTDIPTSVSFYVAQQLGMNATIRL